MRSSIAYLLVFLALKSTAQVSLTENAKLYAHLKNVAYTSLTEHQDTNLAAKSFYEAVVFFEENIKNGYCDALNLAFLTNSYLGNDSLCYQLLKKKIMQNTEQISRKSLESSLRFKSFPSKSFQNSQYFNQFIDSSEFWYASVYCNLDHEYLREVTEINALDQFNRNINLMCYEKLKLSDSASAEILLSTYLEGEQYILVKTLDLIQKNGFLEYEKVGGKFGLLSLFLMHNFNSCSKDSLTKESYVYLDSVILDKVNKGYYPASMYVTFKDRSLTWFHCDNATMYGSQLFSNAMPLTLTAEDWIAMDKNRAEIGLNSILVEYKFLNKKLPSTYPYKLFLKE